MKLSFAIPTYNRATLLKKTIENIAEQIGENQDIDIVISDNASTDNTKDLIEELQLKYPYIKYFKNETNLGMDKNFDNAVIKATGEYVWLFGDDDLLVEGALPKVLNITNKYQNLALIYINWSKRPFLRQDTFCNTADEFLSIAEIGATFISSIIFKRELWQKVEKEKFYGTHFLHYYTILSFLPGNASFCIAKKYVDNPIQTTHHWSNTIDGFKWVFINIPQELYKFEQLLYSKQSIYKAISVLAKALPAEISRCRAINMSFDSLIIQDLKKIYGKYPLYWIQVVLSIYMPMPIISFLSYINIGRIKIIKTIKYFLNIISKIEK